MESVVPPEITAELTQILSNLVLGDNDIRANAEKAVNDRLSRTPELYLLALAQFAIAADTEVMRSFSLVLLRRLLFRSAPLTIQPTGPQRQPIPRLTLYDHLSAQTLTTLERLLLHSLSHEPSQSVRRKSVDTICDVAKQGMARGRPWHALQAQTFTMTQAGHGGAGDAVANGSVSPAWLSRESAYRVFAGCPNLVMDLQTDAVLQVFQRGLQDGESIEVRHASLLASVSYLTIADPPQLAQSLSLMYPLLETIHHLSQNLSSPPLSPAHSTQPTSNTQHLTNFLSDLTPLCTSNPTLFQPHLQALLSFMPQLILPAVDCGPTPTVSRPFPSSSSSSAGRQGAFVFPIPGDSSNGHSSSQTDDTDPDTDTTEDDERSALRLAALEFMVSLSESRPSMVKKVGGWVEVLVRAALEGMGELDEEVEGVVEWLGEDYIPMMLVSYDWRSRHAGLMAIAAIGEGTGKVMQNELAKIVEGQLCTDLEEVIQEQYHQQLFPVLIGALEDPEPRVHSHAAAALINFCEGVERDTLLPYLDPIVTRLLALLNPSSSPPSSSSSSSGISSYPSSTPTNPPTVHRYVQEQAITTLAMVADASEVTFGKYYPTIMPLLLDVLRNAEGREYCKLRIKAMECAGLIESPHDPQDTQLTHYLIATWAKVCQAMGEEFEPYLPVVMPSLLTTASAKADISVYDEDVENMEEKEGWEIIEMEGQTLGIRTSSIDEKCQAFETLVIYCSTLGACFAPYLSQTLEITLPALKFYFHDGVREAAAMLAPMLLSCGKQSNSLTPQMVSAILHQIINCISTEHDSSFLASLFKCFTDCLLLIGGPSALSSEYHNGIIEATKRQLQQLAERRKARTARMHGSSTHTGGGGGGGGEDMGMVREEMGMLEEIEDYALDDMGKMLSLFDVNHPLIVAVSSVKDLGFGGGYGSESDGGEDVG
ncbi:hypothetical protein MD484_g8710, partial [Candolleomyces efflorescens]